MKKLLAGFLSICLALTAAGCGTPDTPDTPSTLPSVTSKEGSVSDTADLNQDTSAGVTMHALVLPTTKEEVFSDDGTLLFTLSYPRASVDLENAETAELITGDLQTRTGGILSEADQICSNAWSDYPENTDWSPYFLDVSYVPTRLDQVVLSLFRNQSSYSGGAHPFVYTDSVTYDLQTGSPLQLPDIFHSDFSKDVLCALVLKALEPKSKELSYNYQETVTQQFSEDTEDRENWYFSQNGLCFHFSPYEIAPYSSGTIIAEIPYSDLTGILQERYFPSQIESPTGSMYAEASTEEAVQRFQRITDVVLDDNAAPVLLYSDAAVADLRVEIGTQLEDDSRFITTSVVFAADTVGIGEAIQIYATTPKEDTLLRLVYRSNDREVSALITSDGSTGNIVLKGQ